MKINSKNRKIIKINSQNFGFFYAMFLALLMSGFVLYSKIFIEPRHEVTPSAESLLVDSTGSGLLWGPTDSANTRLLPFDTAGAYGPETEGEAVPATTPTYYAPPEQYQPSMSYGSERMAPGCGGGDCDCEDFGSFEEAERVFNASLGDPHGLDRDNDGIPCENLLR